MSSHDFDLQLEDDDSKRRWGGNDPSDPKVVAAPGGAVSSMATTDPVAELQRSLRAVGIALGPKATGVFDADTELALREFQLYARMDHVALEDPRSAATEYADKLSQVATGTHRFSGAVSGVYDAGTRAAMDHWIANHWRCPVVLDVWDVKAKPPTRVGRNVWRRDDASVKQHIVRATDFSGRFRPHKAGGHWDVGTSKIWDEVRGPVVGDQQCEATSEVLPESLVGQSWAVMAPDARSRFKVVRAVAEVECAAFFDNVNGYDGGIVSVGIFHWIIGGDGAGELAGVLARVAKDFGAEYERDFKSLGVDVRSAVNKPARFKLQAVGGGFPEPTVPEVQRAHVEYLRSWHWFYRFVMLSREWAPLQRVQWGAALDRIRQIRAASVASTLLDPGAGAPPYTLGDVFSSELAIGYLLRWHVNRPSDIAPGKHAATRISAVIERAKKDAPKLGWAKSPALWGDPEESALLTALEAYVAEWAEEAEKAKEERMEAKKKGSYKPGTTAASIVKSSLARIKSFPNQNPRWTLDRNLVGSLSTARGSYLLAAPAAPSPPPTP